MSNFTIEFVTEQNKKLHADFRKKYKTPQEALSANNEMLMIQETVRGLYVLEKWQREGRNGSPIPVLRFYSMPEVVIHEFIATYLPDLSTKEVETVKTEKRKDKWSAFDSWTKEHQAEQFTTDQLVEVAGFSYQTVLKYVSESPLFGKIKKGLWEVLIIPDRDK
jgi:hypothetical protein